MRAARLVVDTGIHALAWSYEDAAAAYQEATGRSPQLTQSDIYRYAAWPGQAVSYHVGYLTLLDLRARAETALGDWFDLMAFHDALLSLGNAPLSLVGAAVVAFIDTQGSERWKRRGVCRRVADCWDVVSDVLPLDRVGCWIAPLVEECLPVDSCGCGQP